MLDLSLVSVSASSVTCTACCLLPGCDAADTAARPPVRSDTFLYLLCMLRFVSVLTNAINNCDAISSLSAFNAM